MDITLETVNNKTGTILEIGAYRSPVVPRIGEKIALRLTSSKTTPEGEGLPYSAGMIVRVVDVRYVANNLMQTEDWQIPYTHSSEGVFVRVEPTGSAEGISAQDYIARLMRQLGE